MAASERDRPDRLTHSSARRLLRALGAPDAVLLGTPLAFVEQGADQFALLWGRLVTEPEGLSYFRISLAIVALEPCPEATSCAQAQRSLQVYGNTQLPDEPSLAYAYLAEGGASESFQVRHISADDYDNDGALELQIVTDETGEPECAIGQTTTRKLRIFNLLRGGGGPMRIQPAAEVILRARNVVDEIRGTTQLRDVDGDGHPDIELRRKRCVDGEFPPGVSRDDPPLVCHREEVEHHVLRWVATRDAWEPGPPYDRDASCPEEDF